MIKIGDSYTKEYIATDEIVRAIATVSGDTNPIHLDDDYASKSIFQKRIAHGLFCLNAISEIIGNYFPGQGSILVEQLFQYKKPVYIGDTIRVTVSVNDIVEEKNLYVLDTVCEKNTGIIVLKGQTKVLWER